MTRGLVGAAAVMMATDVETGLATGLTMAQDREANLRTSGQRARTKGEGAAILMEVSRTVLGAIGTTAMRTSKGRRAEIVATMRRTWGMATSLHMGDANIEQALKIAGAGERGVVAIIDAVLQAEIAMDEDGHMGDVRIVPSTSERTLGRTRR